ncbi:MAG TPA: sodium-dependent transporter [Rhodothermales bacterium]|nr:sodium-dependent transporter [Rhodothermales bacterium]
MSARLDSNDPQRFSSRWGLILSVLGIAVGTGNIWRFPRIAAQNGGEEGAGAFLVAWIVFLLIWSIPLIVAEYGLGRRSRLGVIGTFANLAGGRFAWMGAFVGFVASAIMFYYSVVAGWCIFYFSEVVVTPLPIDLETATATWERFQAAGWPLILHAVAMGVGVVVCMKGVSSIERANKVLVPSLLIIVVICVVRSLTLPGSSSGIEYLFTPQWSQLGNPRIWLEALTQNAWDTGAGWGLILSYAVYMRKTDSVVKTAFITGFGNNTVSLLAAIMIFGTVFSVLGAEMSRSEVLDVMRSSGPASTGLTFIWMPQLFAKMHLGKALAALFFLGLSFAALSSLISMIELATRMFVDSGLSRRKSLATVGTIGFTMGIPSAISLDFLGNQDFVWGVALMICGAFIAFATIKFGVDRFATEINAADPTDWKLGVVWKNLIRWAVPLQAVVLLVWWMALSATVYAPEDWMNPLNPYSVMTCVVQWGIALLVFVALNRRLAGPWSGRSALYSPD